MTTYLPGAWPAPVHTRTVGHQPEGRPHPWKEGELCSDGDGGDGEDGDDDDGHGRLFRDLRNFKEYLRNILENILQNI